LPCVGPSSWVDVPRFTRSGTGLFQGGEFVEGDTLHSEHNKLKMAGGTPLTDEDREPWLAAVAAHAAERAQRHRVVVLSCSALKAKYRAQLRRGVEARAGASAPRLVWVWLQCSQAELSRRLSARAHEFLSGDALLESQLRALEVDEQLEAVDAEAPAPSVVASIVALLARDAR